MYAGRFSKGDVEHMEADELVRFSRKLADQKKAEKEHYDEAVKKARAQARRRR